MPTPRQPRRGEPLSQREDMVALIAKTNGSMNQAAKEAGMHRITLWRRLKKLGLSDERARVLRKLRLLLQHNV